MGEVSKGLVASSHEGMEILVHRQLPQDTTIQESGSGLETAEVLEQGSGEGPAHVGADSQVLG